MKVGKLRAGVAEMALEPRLGLVPELVWTKGRPPRKPEGYRTPLYVKALVLSNGHDPVALVTLDLLGIDRPDAIRAAELASERSGIPTDGILLTCSHTHAAPSVLPPLHTRRAAHHAAFDDEAKRRERAFVDAVVLAIADVVADASACQQDASVGSIATELPWLTYNRRRQTRNFGTWTSFLGIPQDQACRPEGPIDPELGLFVVRGADHRPLCMVWNLVGHNAFSFGDPYSADLPYSVQHELDDRIGEHIPCLYLPGCSGNVQYFDATGPGGLDKVTEDVASGIMAIYRDACTLPDVKLGGRKVELCFAQQDFSQCWWKHDVHAKRPVWETFLPIELERYRSEAAEKMTYQSDVMALRLGETALVGLPGEVFVEFGLMIKERSPFERTYVAAYSNDYAGYIATRHAFIGGSYEVWPALNVRVGREGGYLMVDKAVELLQELRAQ